jgi:transposase
MAHNFRPWTHDQLYLLPPALNDWVDDDHVIHFVADVVREIDISAIEATYLDKDPRGTVPYHPRMLLALLIYSYSRGVTSSRKIERATWEDVATRVLVGDQHPDHSRIAEFRRRHADSFRQVFAEVLRLCSRAGLVKIGRVALDGTKLQADASKHKAMSYGRMKQTEKRLEREIAALLAEAEATDRAEDRQYGQDRGGDELPEELRRRATRLARIRQAKAELEAAAAAGRAEQLERRAEGREAELLKDDDREDDDREDDEPPKTVRKLSRQERRRLERLAKKSRREADNARRKAQDRSEKSTRGLLPQACDATDLVLHRPRFDRYGDPTETSQWNFTDPDSRIAKMGNGSFAQAYNAQAVVTDGQLIAATDVSNAPPDSQQLPPMLAQTAENCGALPDVAVVDNGYFSQANVDWCDAHGVDAYISVGRKRWKDVPPEAGRARAAVVNMHSKLTTDVGREHYRRRKMIVEPVFGQIKEAMGFRRFRLRGLRKVRGEWNLVTTAHNILKAYRSGYRVAGLSLAPA